jgi:hypothetical protein
MERSAIHGTLRKKMRALSRMGERFLRNPPSVAQQHNAFIKECLAALLVGYGTNGVPHPLYIEHATA